MCVYVYMFVWGCICVYMSMNAYAFILNTWELFSFRNEPWGGQQLSEDSLFWPKHIYQVNKSVCVCVCVCICMYVCVCMRVGAYVCVYIFNNGWLKKGGDWIMFTYRTLPQEGDMTQRQNGTKTETARLWQKYFIDCDDIFFVLLIRTIARSVARFYLSSCPINIPIYQITNALSWNGSTSEKNMLNNASLCHDLLKDFDDFFCVLLTTTIARSLARFYLLSCPINIWIYVFLPHVTLKEISAVWEGLYGNQCAQIVCII